MLLTMLYTGNRAKTLVNAGFSALPKSLGNNQNEPEEPVLMILQLVQSIEFVVENGIKGKWKNGDRSILTIDLLSS